VAIFRGAPRRLAFPWLLRGAEEDPGPFECRHHQHVQRRVISGRGGDEPPDWIVAATDSRDHRIPIGERPAGTSGMSPRNRTTGRIRSAFSVSTRVYRRAAAAAGQVELRFAFPSIWYAYENHGMLAYHPRRVVLSRAQVENLRGKKFEPDFADLILLGLPRRFLPAAQLCRPLMRRTRYSGTIHERVRPRGIIPEIAI
jgi:hypothetical protein